MRGVETRSLLDAQEFGPAAAIHLNSCYPATTLWRKPHHGVRNHGHFMQSDGSVTDWIASLKAEESGAAELLFGRYIEIDA